jgi:glutamate-5-semialdehyde dehydrogenase
LTLRELAERAKHASFSLARLRRARKDAALAAIAAKLEQSAERITRANRDDLDRARAAGLAEPLVDRLTLDGPRVAALARAVTQVASLPDPVGRRSEMRRLENGLQIGRQRIPLGLIAIVYESRPNVTVEAAVLCLKSGNAVLLRGGKEASATNRALVDLMREALSNCGLPEDAVSFVPPGGHDEIRELVSLAGVIDLAIPRGGEGLIRLVVESARVPVIQHYKGVCHLFLDAGADLEMATELTLNGKLQRPGVCNALECLLVDATDVARLLPPILGRLREEGVEIRGCAQTLALEPWVNAASEDDFGTEFLAKILAVRVVDGLDGALAHVERYGSRHTEAICTPSYQSAQRWLEEVDASCVLVNASTRFNDGGELGLGAEIGISTTKLHAYGPMGLDSLTAEKWIVLGEGQVRT